MRARDIGQAVIFGQMDPDEALAEIAEIEQKMRDVGGIVDTGAWNPIAAFTFLEGARGKTTEALERAKTTRGVIEGQADKTGVSAPSQDEIMKIRSQMDTIVNTQFGGRLSKGTIARMSTALRDSPGKTEFEKYRAPLQEYVGLREKLRSLEHAGTVRDVPIVKPGKTKGLTRRELATPGGASVGEVGGQTVAQSFASPEVEAQMKKAYVKQTLKKKAKQATNIMRGLGK
jgi:hypothetical protein